MVLRFLLLNYVLQFLSFDAEPDVEIEYWEESDSELQEDFSTDEPHILTQLHSDDQCTITHKSLIMVHYDLRFTISDSTFYSR